jgi:hypothetical protein
MSLSARITNGGSEGFLKAEAVPVKVLEHLGMESAAAAAEPGVGHWRPFWNAVKRALKKGAAAGAVVLESCQTSAGSLTANNRESVALWENGRRMAERGGAVGGLPLVAGGALLEARTAAPGLRLDQASVARIERMERPDAEDNGLMGRAEDFFSQVRSRLPGHVVVGFASNAVATSLHLGRADDGGGRNPMCLPKGGATGWHTAVEAGSGRRTDGFTAVSLPKCKFAGPSPQHAVGLCLGRCVKRKHARSTDPAASYNADAAWAAESCREWGIPTTRTHRLGVCGEKESGGGAPSGGGDGPRVRTLRGMGVTRRLRAVCLFEGTGAEDPATGEAIPSDIVLGLPQDKWVDRDASGRLLGDQILDQQISLILPDADGSTVEIGSPEEEGARVIEEISTVEIGSPDSVEEIEMESPE